MSELSNMKFSHPAAIISRDVQTRALSDEELMKLAVERAPDPAAFTEFPPLFLPIEATSNRLDAYFTRMAKSSLTNYANEAAEGVSFQDSHQTDALSFMMGRSLTGNFVGAQGNGVSRVLVDLYTVQNLPDTNNFINKYRTGIARDVSIGFYGGRFVCSICSLDMMSWDCWHYPGREYEVDEELDDKTKTVRKVIATADVEDAHLAEISAVYKGATPGAVIMKALRDVEEGRMKPDVARFLEQRYRHLDLNLSRTRRAFPGHSPSEENRVMPAQRTAADAAAGTETANTETADNAAADTTAADEAAVAAAATSGAAAGTEGATAGGAAGTDAGAAASDAAAATAATDDARMLTQFRALIKQRGLEESNLFPGARVFDLAIDGLAYRNALITEALAEGVRAHGADNFKRDHYQKTLRAMDIETVKLMKDDWARQAKDTLPGKRQTSDEADPPNSADRKPPPDVPAGAFM